MNGIDCIAAMQNEFGQTLPPVVMVTAYGQDQMSLVPTSLSPMVKSMLTKPVTRSTMLDTIGQALGKKLVERLHSSRSLHKQQQLQSDMNAVKGSRVLLAEDNEMNQELAIELLNNAGIQVVLAQDGKEALQLLENDQSFDAILMDCQMPVMDGYQATEMLRKRPGLASIPVIAMTADVMDTDREKATRAGMVDHIVKPINVGQMFATLA